MRAAARPARLVHMLNSFLVLHIAAGSVSLASMFVPMLTKKGGQAHRKSGWIFVAGMTVVSITAFVLAGARAVLDPSVQGRRAGLFLLYVALLTAACVSAGVRVLRARKRAGAHRHPWDVGLPSALLAVSAFALIYGLAVGWTLLAAFSLIGFLTGGSQLRYWLRPPAHHMHWWFEHMTAMLGACIAATTAFLVVNADRFGASTFSLAVWLAPTVIGTPTIALWTAYYRRRFSSARTSRGGTREAQLAAPPDPA